MAHIFTGSFWMEVYIAYLSSNMGCYEHSLWMNTTSGVLFSGPEGPPFPLYEDADRSIVVPRTVDMLKDDTFLRFFSKFGSSVDNSVLACAQGSRKFTYLDDLFPVTTDHETEDPNRSAWISPTYPYVRRLWRNLPRRLPMDNIGGLRFGAVYSPSLGAVARRPQGASLLWMLLEDDRRGLVDETALDGGLTRFKFDPTHGGGRVFDTLNVMEGRESFFIMDFPDLKIRSTTRQYESLGAFFNLCDGKPPVEETQPLPIYLFLRPLPTTISELVTWMNGQPYFWSFDETGRCEMSEEECERWGLPVLTCTTLWKDEFVTLWSWPTSTYTALRNWQEARGFDPTTSDWAQQLGYPEFEIIGKRKSTASLRKLLMLKWAAHYGKPL
uniref:Uncharacterized protein n=1 Tax=Moniliophthora roreri TaxID=221103 RepID=A0A0W0EWR1_MONRR